METTTWHQAYRYAAAILDYADHQQQPGEDKAGQEHRVVLTRALQCAGEHQDALEDATLAEVHSEYLDTWTALSHFTSGERGAFPEAGEPGQAVFRYIWDLVHRNGSRPDEAAEVPSNMDPEAVGYWEVILGRCRTATRQVWQDRAEDQQDPVPLQHLQDLLPDTVE